MKLHQKKYDTFHEFVLNDKKDVVGILIEISLWFGLLCSICTALIFFVVEWFFVGVIFAVISILVINKIHNFYKLGGRKIFEGKSTANMLWNKKEIIVKKQ